jgi:exodeoxyribonuclease VII large subunit
MKPILEFSVSEFVAVLNQTLEYAYNTAVIYGELANFSVSKNRWLYFDLKDDAAKLRFFGSVRVMSGPLEEGMILKVRGTPRLHPQYGFSINVISITPVGAGSIKRQQDLLRLQLEKEGLFVPERKRAIPYPPASVGLVTSLQSAAYADFTKILADRWGGVDVFCYDVTVQGDAASAEIIQALSFFAALVEPPDVLVIIRGGGSPEDLAVFSNEQVTRAVAASRIPTLVAIGHERDISLAELAADRRASTPSNAAEVLVPDKKHVSAELSRLPDRLRLLVDSKLNALEREIERLVESITPLAKAKIDMLSNRLESDLKLLNVLNPHNIVGRGYAIVRHNGTVSDGRGLKKSDIIAVETSHVSLEAAITKLKEIS